MAMNDNWFSPAPRLVRVAIIVAAPLAAACTGPRPATTASTTAASGTTSSATTSAAPSSVAAPDKASGAVARRPPRRQAGRAAIAPGMRYRAAHGVAVCKLADGDTAADVKHVAEVLNLAYARRNQAVERPCWERILRTMDVDGRLLSLAKGKSRGAKPSWSAMLWWAGGHRRARHFDVYKLALKRRSEAVRLDAVAQLGRHHAGPEAIDVLKIALADSSAKVRLRAVQAAGDMNHPAVLRSLRERRKIETDAAVNAAIDKIMRR